MLSFDDSAWEQYLYWQDNDDNIIIVQCRYHY